MNDILNEELDSAFISPKRIFKGEELAEYTEGSRVLLSQIRDDNDSGAFFVWAFLYLHILLLKDKKTAISLAWDKTAFRESLLNWVSKMSQEDKDLAGDLVLSILDESNKGLVEPVGNPNALPEPGNK